MKNKKTPEQINAFISALCKALGLTVTPNRHRLFYAWVLSEDMPISSNNLLATTWNLYPTRAAGATVQNWMKNKYFHNWNNGVPVKNYDSFADGIIATANTFKYGNHYPRIVAALKADKAPEQVLKDAGTEFEIWGTGKVLIGSVLKTIPKLPTGAVGLPNDEKKKPLAK